MDGPIGRDSHGSSWGLTPARQSPNNRRRSRDRFMPEGDADRTDSTEDAAAKPSGPPPSDSKPAALVEDWESRFKYLLADFENYRRRVQKDRQNAEQDARGRLLADLLPLVEAVEKAGEAVHSLPPANPVRRGVELVIDDWRGFLNRHGVTPVASGGTKFRADDHEAVGEASVTLDHPEGSIVEVVQQGYRSAYGLLRPAKVVVARRPPPSPAPVSAPSEVRDSG